MRSVIVMGQLLQLWKVIFISNKLVIHVIVNIVNSKFLLCSKLQRTSKKLVSSYTQLTHLSHFHRSFETLQNNPPICHAFIDLHRYGYYHSILVTQPSPMLSQIFRHHLVTHPSPQMSQICQEPKQNLLDPQNFPQPTDPANKNGVIHNGNKGFDTQPPRSITRVPITVLWPWAQQNAVNPWILGLQLNKHKRCRRPTMRQLQYAGRVEEGEGGSMWVRGVQENHPFFK